MAMPFSIIFGVYAMVKKKCLLLYIVIFIFCSLAIIYYQIYTMPAVRYRNQIYDLVCIEDTSRVYQAGNNSILIQDFDSMYPSVIFHYKWYGESVFTFAIKDDGIKIWGEHTYKTFSDSEIDNYIEEWTDGYKAYTETGFDPPHIEDALRIYTSFKTSTRGTGRAPINIFLIIFAGPLLLLQFSNSVSKEPLFKILRDPHRHNYVEYKKITVFLIIDIIVSICLIIFILIYDILHY